MAVSSKKMATKSDLRTQFLAKRKAFSAQEVERRSLAIAELLYKRIASGWADRPTFVTTDIDLSAQPTSTRLYFHTFLPIARQKEVNTWPIIHQIWRDFPQISIAVSVTNPVNQSLTNYELTPETILIENRWGIPEPVANEQQQSDVSAVSNEQFGMVFIPLLAFDLHGHRVGYGEGYYDRFLAECHPDCLKVGLSLFEPVDKIDDVEETDVPLNACITPERVFAF